MRTTDIICLGKDLSLLETGNATNISSDSIEDSMEK